MSAGRLQLFDKLAGPRDRTSRLLVRIEPSEGEDGPARAAPARVRLQAGRVGEAAGDAAELDEDEALAKLGPEAWPDPGGARGAARTRRRPLHALLRDQRTIAGIGRSWVDEILWEARLSPYKRGADLDDEEAAALREAIVSTLGGALEHYEQVVALPIPDKLPMPLKVHRHEGEPCPRCGETLRGRPLRGLRGRLLPPRADRGARAQGPAAVAAAEVGEHAEGPPERALAAVSTLRRGQAPAPAGGGPPGWPGPDLGPPGPCMTLKELSRWTSTLLPSALVTVVS